MINYKKNQIKKEIKTSKTFNYKKNSCNLSFSLSIDENKELIDFKSCLEEATKDINNLLK